MSGILLLLGLTSSICGFVMRRTSYPADEGDDVTLSFDRVTAADISHASMVCVHSLGRRVLYEMVRGLEVLSKQHPQFVGRVRCDKDALRDGQVSLQVSRVTTNDTGNYWCDLMFERDDGGDGRPVTVLSSTVLTLNVSPRNKTADKLPTAKPEGADHSPQELQDDVLWVPVFLLVVILICLILCPIVGVKLSFPSAAKTKTFSSSASGLRRSSSSEPLRL